MSEALATYRATRRAWSDVKRRSLQLAAIGAPDDAFEAAAASSAPFALQRRIVRTLRAGNMQRMPSMWSMAGGRVCLATDSPDFAADILRAAGFSVARVSDRYVEVSL